MNFIGRESISYLKKIVSPYQNILLFHGKTVFKEFGELLNNQLNGKTVLTYDNISNNPKQEEIEVAINSLSHQEFDAVLAFGGGSVIDFAKAFRYYTKKNIPFIAIPTTAGTGSEATQFAVIYINGVKTSLDDISILPNTAIIDSQFIENSPTSIKAPAAMDAFCQAIESFWAKKSTMESKKYALESISLCQRFLVSAVKSSNIEANEKLALAAHFAGKAINISRTTAAHALSYKITSLYGLPHGHAVALSIAGLFKQNLEVLPQEEQNMLLNAMQLDKTDIHSYFHQLMTDIGLEDNLEKLGIEKLDEIVDSVNVQRLDNNPKNLSREDLMRILKNK